MSGARPPTDAPLRVALVGAGFMGAFHADTLARLPGASLTVVVDASLDAATRAAAPSRGRAPAPRSTTPSATTSTRSCWPPPPRRTPP
jgi:predicted homoserine dehydrogenase-like protein